MTTFVLSTHLDGVAPNVRLTQTTMKLPIYLYGHPVLREMSQDITPDYLDLDKLIEDMWETMYHSDGIGLAAPQIGKAIRLFVIDASPMGDDFPECKGFKKAFINARIMDRGETLCTENEGCLSIPNIHEKVERPESITIEYLNERFEPQTETIFGFAARVVQHEYDHIDGILFIDHISAIRKQMIRSKLMNITKGQVRTSYRVVAPSSKKR